MAAAGIIEALGEAARLEMDVEQTKVPSVTPDGKVDTPPELVAGTRSEPEGRLVAPDHPVEPSPAHREPDVDVVIAGVVAPGEMEVVVAGGKDPRRGARPVDLLEGDDVRGEVASVTGEDPVVVLAPGDRAAPQRAARSPVQQVEVPARDPDPCRPSGRRPSRALARARGRGRRRWRRSEGRVGGGGGLPAGLPLRASARAPSRAAGADGPFPVAVAGAARPMIVAAVRRHAAGMSRRRGRKKGARNRERRCGRPELRHRNEAGQPYLKGSERAFM